jgi:hypothetical protein
LLEDYNVIDFPTTPNIVYVLFFDMNGAEVYFYVGQTSRHIGRLGDYVSGKFTAATDFRVGEAIKYLQEKKLVIRVKYREVLNSKSEERDLIQQLSRKFKLLNHLPAYNYLKSTPDAELTKVRRFIDEVLSEYT